MELTLNLAWVALAALMFCMWLRHTSPIGPERCVENRWAQFVSLAMLVLILFPVISVTDDLQAIQNPAETDTCQRRDHLICNAHSIFPAVAPLPLPIFSPLSFAILLISKPSRLPAPVIDYPALASIQSRPPPAA